MLREEKESVVAGIDHGISKQVELEVKAYDKVQDGTSTQPIQDDEHDFVDDTNEEQQQEYSIATGRARFFISSKICSCRFSFCHIQCKRNY